MTPHEYYQQQIQLYTQRLKHIKRQRNWMTTAKLLTFAGIVFQIYSLINTGTLPILFPLGTITLFIFLTILDSRIVRQQKVTEELLRINDQEDKYLNGQLTPFPTGKNYLDPAHHYANDLDLFGEESLFQHLNRTVTPNGTHQLASWLLHLSTIPGTICQRQQAVAELAENPEWCHQFRTAGKINPTQEIDSKIFQKWETHPCFFNHPRSTRIFLYLSNGTTLLSVLLSSLQLIPWPIFLILFFTQLLILALYLKKMNFYHHQLEIFIRTMSHYLPLVHLIHQQNFSSTDMLHIKKLLNDPSHNALKALSILHKIQENLDQRGNILVTFLLNGLYLKDLHIMLKLDLWKKAYCSSIRTWSTAISETDALVSMANYRFNHPSYHFPEFNADTLLEVRDAGHPLLPAYRNVTNNFKIDTQHQLFIVTGANMAGKSTFLRTIGVNLVLAQSGNVVNCAYFSCQPMALFTSMRTTDNLAKDTSYFHAELLRLKQLVHTAEHEERLFIILDEMLKGTNSVDKLNGSLAFLKKLLSYPVSGLVATHDLALGELAHTCPNHFFNVCFEINHTDGHISYDYKLHPGVSNTMNASILLKQMGLI